MTTPKRVTSNRRNAEKLNGPKPTRGKARSRPKASKPGVDTMLPVLPGEDAELYQGRLDAWTGHLAPRGPVELYLVERAVQASWQLDRADRCQVNRLTADPRAAVEVDAAGRAPEIPAGAERLAFDDSDSGERLRHHQLACGQMLLRTLDALATLKRTSASGAPGNVTGPDLPLVRDEANRAADDPAVNEQATVAAVGGPANASQSAGNRSLIEEILAEIMAQASRKESSSIPIPPCGREPAASFPPSCDARDEFGEAERRHPSTVEPTRPADRREMRIGPRSSPGPARSDRESSRSEWPGHGAVDSRPPSAPHCMNAPARRPSQDHESGQHEPALRRRVGGYEIPLDQWAPVTGADKAPVRLRRQSTRDFREPASECTTS